MVATLHVCTTCRRAGESFEGETRPGAALLGALAGLDCPGGLRIVPVECLSACSQGCAVALSEPGKWSYVYGRLGPEDAGAVLEGAAQYVQSADGLVPWRARPEIFRKQSIARIPPHSLTPEE